MANDRPRPEHGSDESRHVGWQARVLFLVATALVLTVLFWPGAGDEDSDRAPGGELETAAGNEVELDGLMAPVTLVHFWSTWCPPCIVETPAIQRLAADYDDRPGFSLVMVAVADDVEAAVEFLGDANATLFDPDWKIAHSYGTEKLPETHLVVRGQVVRSFIGATDWDAPAVRQAIDQALASAEG